jgi:hypothetical protein
MRILREPDVIANTDTEVCKLSFEDGELRRTWLTEVRFKERDASGNVDIKQVLLPMLSCYRPISVKAE